MPSSSAMIESVKRFMPARPAVAERIPDRDVEQAQLGIDRRRLPDSAAVSFTADPCGTGDLPALIFSSCGTVLKCQRTFPDFASTANMCPPGMWFSLRVPDVEHAVMDLRAVVNYSMLMAVFVRVSRLQHIQDDAGLTVVAKAWKGFPVFASSANRNEPPAT